MHISLHVIVLKFRAGRWAGHMLLGELDQNECRRDDAAQCGALSQRGESEKERETLKPKISQAALDRGSLQNFWLRSYSPELYYIHNSLAAGHNRGTSIADMPPDCPRRAFPTSGVCSRRRDGPCPMRVTESLNNKATKTPDSQRGGRCPIAKPRAFPTSGVCRRSLVAITPCPGEA